MKISKKKENAKASVAAKPQKTLLDFFQKQGTFTSQVEKVPCPACNTQIIKSKINWHLDQDCKSKEKVGIKKGRKSAIKEKRVKKDGKEKKKKKRAMLSDSEDEEDDDIEIVEPKMEKEEENDSNDFYINESMVEVMMDENSDEKAKNTDNTPIKVDEGGEAVSPYFSNSSAPSNFTPGKRKEKVIINQIPKIEINSIAQLQADWDSPQPTPEKVEQSPASKAKQPTPSTSRNSSPRTVAAKMVKKMLEDDWNLCSPQTTPSKDVKGIIGENKGKLTPSRNGYPECTSDEEFEEEVIVFRTPNKPKPKNSAKKSAKKSPEKAMKESGVDKNMLTIGRSNSALKSPESSQGSTALESEGDSLPLFSPVRSPGLVSPTRSPTPSPDCKTLNPVIRKLFTFPESPQHTPDSSPEASPSKLELSPQINNNVYRFNRINKMLTSKEDAFDALSQSISQKSTSPTKSPKKSRLAVRTPRKINQSIRSSGLLQNSSQSSLNVVSPRNKKHRSPLGSNSNSPVKESPGTSSQMMNPETVEKTPGYDPAVYRDKRGYYLDNFMRILDTVMSQPQDLQLLNDEDLSVIQTFRGLSLSAQKLYVRLFQRKIKWNRVFKIEYKDICDAEDTVLYINELTYANFLLKGTVIIIVDVYIFFYYYYYNKNNKNNMFNV